MKNGSTARLPNNITSGCYVLKYSSKTIKIGRASDLEKRLK